MAKRKASKSKHKRKRPKQGRRRAPTLGERISTWLEPHLGRLREGLSPRAFLPALQRWLIALFLFALPLVIYLGNTEYGYTKAIFALFMVSFLLVLEGLRLLLQRERLWLTPLFLPGVALLLAGAVSMVHATAIRISLQSLNLLLYFFLFYLLVVNHTRDERDLLLYLGSILGAAFLASVYGILQYHGLLAGTPGVPRGTGAIISSLGNRNYLGGFISYLFWPGFILLLRGRSWPARGFALLCLGTIFYTLLLVRSTGAWVGLTVAGLSAVAGFLHFRLHRAFQLRKGWAVIGALLLLLLMGISLTIAPLGTSLGELPAPTSVRSELGLGLPVIDQLVKFWQRNAGRVRAWDWWVGWEMFKDHPLTGIGLGHYKVRFLEYKAKFLATPRGKHYDFYILRAAQAHNEYVQLAAETGLLGVLAGGFALFMVLFTGLRRLKAVKAPGDKFIALMLLAGIMAVLVHALVSFPFHLPASALAFVLLLGLLNSRFLAERAGEFSSKGKRSMGWRGWLLRPVAVFDKRTAYAFLAGVLVLGVSVTTLAYRDFIADTYLDKGQIALKMGRVAQAEEYLKRSLELDFQPTSVLYWLGSIYHQRAQEKQDRELIRRSIRYLKDSLRSFQVEPAYLQLAALYRLLGDYEEAERYLKSLLAMSPSPERRLKAEYLAALIARDRGDVEGALEKLTALIAAHPDFEEAYVTRAQLYAQQGNEGLAQLDLQKALEIVKNKLKRTQRTLQRLIEQRRLTRDKFAELQQELEKLKREKELIEQMLLG